MNVVHTSTTHGISSTAYAAMIELRFVHL